MEKTAVIPGLKECVIKACDDFVWDSTRNLLLQSLEKDSLEYQQLTIIPKDSNIIVYCCLNGFLKLISIFINNGFSVNHNISGKRSHYFNSMLHFATIGQQLCLMKYLVCNGADVNCHSARGITPLYCIFKYMQGLFIQMEIDDSYGKVRFPEVRSSSTEVIKFLLESGSVVNIKHNCKWFSPLHYAVLEYNVDFVKLLIQYGADVNTTEKCGELPLLFAVSRFNPSYEIVELLLNAGADANSVSCYGYSALHLALVTERPDILEILLERGAMVDAKSYHDETPLYRYVFCKYCICDYHGVQIIQEECINVVGTLVIWGADTNIFDPDGRTLLHWAAWVGNLNLVKLLIDNGLDVKDKFGKKAIHYAADRGHHNIVQYFIGYYYDKLK